jgi:threonine/homoserine/homoserine lactone efflux protein
MNLHLFLRGLVIGFSIAAPVGPIGVLCIRRTLADGRVYGLASGLGAASADGFYGLIAALGLTLVADFLRQQQMWLGLIGGGYLLYLGVKTFRAMPAETAADAGGRGAPQRSLIGAYASTLFLTLTNPLTIFAFAAIFAGVGAAVGAGSGGALLVVAGVFAGSCAWWLILVTFTGLFRTRLGPIGLRWINRLSGIVIAGFGVAVLYGLIAPS